MANTKTQNYTPEQTREIVNLFVTGTTVEQIAEQFSKTTRSVIAKLSREGVYKAKEKAGEARVKKSQMIRDLEFAFGVEENAFQSLEKASWEALNQMWLKSKG